MRLITCTLTTGESVRINADHIVAFVLSYGEPYTEVQAVHGNCYRVTEPPHEIVALIRNQGDV